MCSCIIVFVCCAVYINGSFENFSVSFCIPFQEKSPLIRDYVLLALAWPW